MSELRDANDGSWRRLRQWQIYRKWRESRIWIAACMHIHTHKYKQQNRQPFILTMKFVISNKPKLKRMQWQSSSNATTKKPKPKPKSKTTTQQHNAVHRNYSSKERVRPTISTDKTSDDKERRIQRNETIDTKSPKFLTVTVEAAGRGTLVISVQLGAQAQTVDKCWYTASVCGLALGRRVSNRLQCGHLAAPSLRRYLRGGDQTSFHRSLLVFQNLMTIDKLTTFLCVAATLFICLFVRLLVRWHVWVCTCAYL